MAVFPHIQYGVSPSWLLDLFHVEGSDDLGDIFNNRNRVFTPEFNISGDTQMVMANRRLYSLLKPFFQAGKTGVGIDIPIDGNGPRSSRT